MGCTAPAGVRSMALGAESPGVDVVELGGARPVTWNRDVIGHPFAEGARRSYDSSSV
jgi:hypothetical protein